MDASVSSLISLSLSQTVLNSDLREDSKPPQSNDVEPLGMLFGGGENQKPQQKCCDKHLKAIQRAPFFPRTPSLPPCLHLSSYVFASCSMPFLTPLLNDFFFFFPSILHKGLVQFCHYSYYCWWLQTKSWLLSSGVIGNCRCERAH